MDMSGEQRIEAPRDVVWAALNDPQILRKCIPGCQKLDKFSDTEMAAIAVIKVGPISAKFQGAVTLSDLDPPNGYRIIGEGQGGVAGFAKGSAEVRLTADGEATILRYSVSAQIGGKLSQLGGRLIDATARKMSDAFFKRFADEIAAGTAAPQPAGQAIAGTARTASLPAGAVAPSADDWRRPETSPESPTAAPPAATSWMAWLNIAVLTAAIIAIAGTLLVGGAGRPPLATSMVSSTAELSSIVLLFLILAVGYLAGRQHEASRASFSDRQLLLALLSRRGGTPEL
ncbi:MAG: carbon monoxide dehydrogenase subunit G [Chelatococcus sp.]|uniref:SRPBCC family protein n=1 Tax=Chelatococcus sp. TaxID=1953771 RepID=UPI0025C5AD7B|nr:carbon monoxide dehydrogenase subunit G [Chelatococcus sp.]MBX3539384.1 carbon monoxide dehydrogenase subunit G [Chelatococcus sp.]